MKRKDLKLDAEEQAILDAFEKGELQSVPNVESEIARTREIFKAHGKKTKRVNLRMTEWDYAKAQEKALQEGIPYQTYLSSLIHKALSGQFNANKSIKI